MLYIFAKGEGAINEQFRTIEIKNVDRIIVQICQDIMDAIYSAENDNEQKTVTGFARYIATVSRRLFEILVLQGINDALHAILHSISFSECIMKNKRISLKSIIDNAKNDICLWRKRFFHVIKDKDQYKDSLNSFYLLNTIKGAIK